MNCPSCETRAVEGQRFCSRCGFNLGALTSDAAGGDAGSIHQPRGPDEPSTPPPPDEPTEDAQTPLPSSPSEPQEPATLPPAHTGETASSAISPEARPGPTPSLPLTDAPQPDGARVDTAADVGTGDRGRIVRYALGGASVLGVGALAFSFLSGLGGGGGGAGSPEAAVRQLANAIAKEDPAAILDILPPNEVGALSDVYGALEARAKKSGFAAKGSSPASGIDLEIDDLELEVTDLGDDVAKVELTGGQVSYTIDPSKFPERVRAAVSATKPLRGTERIDDEAADAIAASVYGRVPDEVVEGEPEDALAAPFLVAVRQNGGWYVSPSYTLAQTLIEILDLPDGDFDSTDSGPKTSAGDEPEEALSDLVEALGELKIEDSVAGVSSSELPALSAYSVAIEEFVERVVMGAAPEVAVDDLRVEASELGDGLSKVVIEEFSATASATIDEEYVSLDVDFDGRCVKQESSDGDSTRDCVPNEFRRLTGIQDFFLVMSQEDGAWTVNPLASLAEYGRILVENVDDDVALRAFGLEHAGRPAGTLEPGEEVRGTLNKGGFQVYDVKVTEGEDLAVHVDGNDDVEVSLLMPDGHLADYPDVGGSYCGACAYRIKKSGTARLILASEDAFDSGSFTIAVDRVEGTSATIPGEITGRLAPGEVKVYRLEGSSGPDGHLVTIDGDAASFEVVDRGGSYLYCDVDEPCDLSGATLYVYNPDSDPANFTVSVEPPPDFGFVDGGTTASGSLSGGGSDSFDLVCKEGTNVVVTATPSDAFLDIVLTVETPDYESFDSDTGYEGDSERVSISVGATGICTVTVEAYGGGSGGFTVSASQS